MRNDRNLLEGSLLKSLIFFCLPLMASGMLQVAFNAADIVVVGRYAQDGALAAVSATSSLVHLVTNLFLGFSVGVAVSVAQSIGAQDFEEANDHLHNGIASAFLLGMLVLVLGMLASRPVLTAMDTGAVLEPATVYVRIYFLGAPAMMVYNFGAAAYRAMGDTRRPLLYLILSGITNFLCNLFFVLVLDWKKDVTLSVMGVAIATVISQYLSAILLLIGLLRREDFLHLDVRRIRIMRSKFLRILQIGLPAGIQSSMFSLSNLLVQSNINAFGTVAQGSHGAATSYASLADVAMDAFNQASLTFVGQYKGARREREIPRIFAVILGVALLVAVALGFLFIWMAPLALRLYLPEGGLALEFAVERIVAVMQLYFSVALMQTATGALRGLGYATTAMTLSILGICGLRFVYIYAIYPALCIGADIYAAEVAVHNYGQLMGIYPFTWICTGIMELAAFAYLILRGVRKQKQTLPTR